MIVKTYEPMQADVTGNVAYFMFVEKLRYYIAAEDITLGMIEVTKEVYYKHGGMKEGE